MRFRSKVSRRFSRGSRLAKKHYSWITTGFSEVSVSTTGGDATTLYLVLFDPGVIVGATDINTMFHVKRIIFSGGVGFVPQSTTLASDIVHLISALYTQDNDDTTSGLANDTTATSIWNSERVLWYKSHTGTIIENTGVFTQNWIPPLDLSFDVRLNVKVRLQELVQLAVVWVGSVTSTVNLSAVSGFSRVLVEWP